MVAVTIIRGTVAYVDTPQGQQRVEVLKHPVYGKVQAWNRGDGYVEVVPPGQPSIFAAQQATLYPPVQSHSTPIAVQLPRANGSDLSSHRATISTLTPGTLVTNSSAPLITRKDVQNSYPAPSVAPLPTPPYQSTETIRNGNEHYGITESLVTGPPLVSNRSSVGPTSEQGLSNAPILPLSRPTHFNSHIVPQEDFGYGSYTPPQQLDYSGVTGPPSRNSQILSTYTPPVQRPPRDPHANPKNYSAPVLPGFIQGPTGGTMSSTSQRYSVQPPDLTTSASAPHIPQAAKPHFAVLPGHRHHYSDGPQAAVPVVAQLPFQPPSINSNGANSPLALPEDHLPSVQRASASSVSVGPPPTAGGGSSSSTLPVGSSTAVSLSGSIATPSHRQIAFTLNPDYFNQVSEDGDAKCSFLTSVLEIAEIGLESLRTPLQSIQDKSTPANGSSPPTSSEGSIMPDTTKRRPVVGNRLVIDTQSMRIVNADIRHLDDDMQSLSLSNATLLDNDCFPDFPRSLTTLIIPKFNSQLIANDVQLLPRTLKLLDLSSQVSFTTDCAIALPPYLETLILTKNKELNNTSLNLLPKSLTALILNSNEKVDGFGFSNLPPNLRLLCLNSVMNVNALQISVLPKTLRRLELRKAPLGDDSVEKMSAMQELQYLDISSSKISSSCIKHFPRDLRVLIAPMASWTGPSPAIALPPNLVALEISIAGKDPNKSSSTKKANLAQVDFIRNLPPKITALVFNGKALKQEAHSAFSDRLLLLRLEKTKYLDETTLSQLPRSLLSLSIPYCKTLGDKALVSRDARSGLPPRLIFLDMAENDSITSACLSSFSAQLQYLDISSSKIKKSEIFQSTFPKSLTTLLLPSNLHSAATQNPQAFPGFKQKAKK